MTTIPRWAPDPRPGVAEYETALPYDLVAGARRLAAELDRSLGTVLLAAHAKVLAALSGDPDVTTGYVVGRGHVLPRRLANGAGSWRALLGEAGRAVSVTLLPANRPDDGNCVTPSGSADGPAYEVELDPTGNGDDTDLAEGIVARIVFGSPDGRLRLRYRTDVLDPAAAERIAGYHRTALTRMVVDPDADHDGHSLLSDAELRLQVDGLAGPRRELPDHRVHELFEQRVRAHPDAVAVVRGDTRLTYAELNARANQLGRALLARGLGREDVVAVVTERSPDWVAAVLAVFKAGGGYLPIEPQFPPDRITAMIARSDCRLALVEPGSPGRLTAALATLPGVEAVRIDAAYAEDHADGDLGVDVAADQLAYIYFTSGSTGEPKGAMCEHAGMLNHLYAKLDDLEIGSGDTVAQTAPQCFDISLWQAVSALLVGGRTRLVEQKVILDAERFVDTLVGDRVTVAQVVPSYLDAVLAYLDGHPRELPDLRCVSVTGEALPPELARRWFAAQPDIRLVNAYGLTETSDDTNHEVMTRPPDRERVPLGRPVNNVRVYVVDERLTPVPLGTPGEIVFSGVCVGRGYVNDPHRTRLAFGTDPYREGERLYRSGDYGRWLPDGKLEFLGRRDAQVKVSGFRIEIGDVENALTRVRGVRHAAAVVVQATGRGAQLVAFYSGRPLGVDRLREQLGQWLPAYLIPSAFHWKTDLPLTPNGKVDRTALTALAERLDPDSADVEAPSTPTERRVAAAWARVLGVPPDRIGRRDHFFDRGGTSLSAVKLVVALDRAVSLEDVTRHPVLADLADHLPAPLPEHLPAPGAHPHPKR